MKKTFKRLVSLMLCACLLVGLPMAVQATDTAEEELKLLYATKVPDIMANRSNDTAADKRDRAIALYFNKTVNWEKTKVGLRIQALDKDGNIFSFVSSEGKTEASHAAGKLFENYFNATIQPGNPIVVQFESAKRNFSFFGDADHPVDHFRLVIFDTGAVDGKFDGITVDGTPLTTTEKVNISGNWYCEGTPYTGERDAIFIDVDEKEDVLVVNSVEILNDRQVHVGFSEAVTINKDDIAVKYNPRLAVTKRAYQSVSQSYDYSYVTGGFILASSSMITIDEDGKGLTVLFAAGQINTLLDSFYTYRKDNPSTDYCLTFSFNETGLQAEANGESSGNFFVDAIRGRDTNKPLYVNANGRENAFCEIDSAVPLCVKPIDNNRVQLILSCEAQLRNEESITVDGQQATVTAVENTSSIDGVTVASAWTLTVANPLADEVEVDLGEDAFYEVEASTISNKTEVDSSAAEIKLEDNAYNFMNADTGRVLAVGEIDELTPEKAGHNLYAFKIEDQYVDLTGGVPELTDAKIVYGLRACANDRYQIVIGHGVVADTDEGDTNIASLALKVGTSTSITTGWYLTEAGGQRPLKVLPFGDSITYGVNDDVKNAGRLQIGWRDTVSQELLTYFNGRVVFVGPEKSTDTTLTDNILLRHAGYPGWVVDGSVYTTSKKGLASLSENIKTKYVPDVTLLMIGTNDLGELNSRGGLTNEELADLMIRYESLVRSIAPKLVENGAVFASKLTPRQREDLNDNIVRFNEELEATVKSLQSDDLAVYLNDNYTDFPTDAENQGWCDLEYAENRGLHLNDRGDAFVASQYVGMVKFYYGQDGERKQNARITAQINGMPYATLDEAMAEAAKTGAEIDLLDNVDVTNKMPFVLDAGVTLDLNGYELSTKDVLAFGHIIDSTDGKGKLIVGENARVSLQTENTAMPLYDDGGYRFFGYTESKLALQVAQDGSWVKFGIQFVFTNDEAYYLLASDENADQVVVNLTATKDGKEQKFMYYLKSTTLRDYADARTGKKSDVDPTKAGISLTVSGISGLESISGTPCFVSPTYMVYTGATGTHIVTQ